MNAHNEQQNIIAGALFDLMGYLTCREKKLCLSASDDAAPAVEALTEWAEKRGFDLDAARVTDWQAGLAAQPAAAQEAVSSEPYGWHLVSNGKGRQEDFTRSPIMGELIKAGMNGTVEVTPLFDHPPPAASFTATPAEMSPEFTDTARAAIAWVLWHHQGASSPVGLPLRFALGMGAYEPLPDWRIAEAKRYAVWAGATTAKFHEARAITPAAPGIDLSGKSGLLRRARSLFDQDREYALERGDSHHAGQCTKDIAGIDALIDAGQSNCWPEGSYAERVERLMGMSRGEREAIGARPVDSPKGGSDEAAWRSPNVLPDVAPGAMGWFWVAVRRESGRIYSFPATYLNALPLNRDDFDPIEKQERGNRWQNDPPAESDECCMIATGWHDVKEHSEYDGFYAHLLSRSDELVAWRPVQDFAIQVGDAEVQP